MADSLMKIARRSELRLRSTTRAADDSSVWWSATAGMQSPLTRLWMKRFFWFFNTHNEPEPTAWRLSTDQRERLLAMLSDIGLQIVDQARGPIPLLAFGRRVLERLENDPAAVPLPPFTEALKRIIRDMNHDRLRVMSPSSFPGVGYIYDATDPETWPIRSSH